MPQHPTQHAAIAGPDDQHICRRAVRQQRHMGQHFLIHELIGLGDLDHAIQHHDAAMREAFEYHDILEIAFHPRQFAFHQKSLTPVGIKRFVEPAIGGHPGSP